MAVSYTKTATLYLTDGTTATFTGAQAISLQNRFDQGGTSGRYWKTVDPDTGVITYYDVDSAACGVCKVLEVTPGTGTVEDLKCEDGLPDCETTESGTTEPTA